MKAANVVDRASELAPVRRSDLSVTVVDLNNFATFPTLAVGILLAVLRNAGFGAKLLSPLAHDVPAAEREHADSYVDHLVRKLHHSTWPPAAVIRDLARLGRNWKLTRPHPRVIGAVKDAIEDKPDAILVSAYLQHYPTVVEIGRMCLRRNMPLMLGGPMFNMPETVEVWRRIPGVTAVVGAEVDGSLPALVAAMCHGEDLSRFDGVATPSSHPRSLAAPFRPLNETPVPDFTDFPWDRYRVRIIPVMTGRGCQWDKCVFCSDVVSVNGRTYRTRTVESVMHEMREQSRRHQTKSFMFLDMKLNSNPAMFRGIVENVQRNVRGAQWIGTVHVDSRRDNGLSRGDLRAAAAAGMRRVSFGLESGSQRLLDAMRKGSTVEANSEFIRNAYEAGLSVRCTMFSGFPGETTADLEQTAEFLERHAPFIDRIRCNAFSIQAGTPIFQSLLEHPEDYPDIKIVRHRRREARAGFVHRGRKDGAYYRQKARVLQAVHEINSRKIRSSAREFDGLM